MPSVVIVIVASMLAMAMAQLTFPPDVAYVNSPSITVTGTVQGVSLSGSGSYQYVAGSASTPYLTHSVLSISAMGQQATAEAWLSITQSMGAWSGSAAGRTNGGPCQVVPFGNGIGSIACQPWTKTANKWGQSCSINAIVAQVGLSFSATTSNGVVQAYVIGLVVNGTDLGSVALKFNQNTPSKPPASAFTPPSDCTPVVGGEKRAIEGLLSLIF
jgi:hypothetical protein